MKTIEEILASRIELKYDMHVEFKLGDRPKTFAALYFLTHADGKKEEAGAQLVSFEFMQVVADEVIKQQFQQTADYLISTLSK